MVVLEVISPQNIILTILHFMNQILEIHTSQTNTSITICILSFFLIHRPQKGKLIKHNGKRGNTFFYCLYSPRATDINPIAAQCTSQTAKQNGVHVCCVVTDLVSCNLECVPLG